ncbi:hypothetical protein Tco_0586447 [Tanacetum coccineum]
MDDPNITMTKYIQLEEEKARRRGQEFNWKITTYGKVGYLEIIDYFKDFENQFLAIVYNDALTSEPEVSSDFENEFPAIVYNDALTSKPEVSSEPTGFAAALAVLITGASQSRQHDTLVRLPMDIRLKIDLENQSVCQDANGSHKSPTKSLFDVGSNRISIFTVKT